LPRLDAVLQGPRQRLDLASHKFSGALGTLVARKRSAFEARAARLQAGTLRREVQIKRSEVSRAAERLRPVMQRRLAELRRGLDAQARVLETLSYERVLARGFALVTGPAGRLARSAKAIREGDALRLRFSDGEVAATAGSGGAPPPASTDEPVAAAPRPRIRRRSPSDQGDLF
jgi:exodeoxyribonuclease VII large subunit